MSKGREIDDYLRDILNACAEVEEFTRGMEFDSFVADKKTVNAVIRSLEVIGEATKHIPASFRRKHPEIPWSKMSRNCPAAWQLSMVSSEIPGVPGNPRRAAYKDGEPYETCGA
jgi:hypothetical protein